MASTQAVVCTFDASDLYRETSSGYDTVSNSVPYITSNGASRGVSLNKFVIASQLYEYYNLLVYIPLNVTITTGLTWKFALTDDGCNSADLGLVVRLEVTPYNLSTASAPVDWSLAGSKGTVTTTNVTLNATSGVIATGTVAIVAANLASLASGNWLGFRVRRVGDNAADTCANRVILLGGLVYDT
jgi:hypothetical protein